MRKKHETRQMGTYTSSVIELNSLLKDNFSLSQLESCLAHNLIISYSDQQLQLWGSGNMAAS